MRDGTDSKRDVCFPPQNTIINKNGDLKVFSL